MPETTNINTESFLKRLLATGAHYGFTRSRRHPSVKPFIFGYKNKQTIIDLERTVDEVERAKTFLKNLGRDRKNILIVGTKAEARDAVTSVAESLGVPYVTERWIGGTFTNFKQVRGRIDRMLDIEEKDKKGELGVYTKKERGLIAKEAKDLRRFFGTLVDLKTVPAAVIVVDSGFEAIAVAEAQKAKAQVIALTNSDSDIRSLDYTIVMNDRSRDTIKLALSELAAAYQAGKTEAKANEAKAAEAPKE